MTCNSEASRPESRRSPETIGDKSLLSRFEELLDLSAREFLPKSGLFLWVEVSFLPIPTCFGYQLDMPVMQRGEHLAENIEELIVTGLPRDFWSVGVILLFPVDIPQLEKWIPVVEGLPQLFEILFRVANDHGIVDLSTSPGEEHQLQHRSSLLQTLSINPYKNPEFRRGGLSVCVHSQ